MSETVAIIPARWGSKRFPGKALADIHGKPLIRHVYERVMRAKRVDRIVVATDDKRIAKAVRAFGGEAVMTSPEHKSGTDRVVEAMRKTGGDIIVNVQGDEPLISPADIDAVIKKIEEDTTIVCATAAFEVRDEGIFRDPNAVKVVMDRDGRALYFTRSPVPFCRDGKFDTAFVHIGIYAFKRDFLERWPSLERSALEEREKLEQLRILENGYRIGVVVTDHGITGVSTPEDLERVRRLMEGSG